MCIQGMTLFQEPEKIHESMAEPTNVWFELPFAPERQTPKGTSDSLNSSQELDTPSRSVQLPLRSCHVLTGGGKAFPIPKRGPSLPFAKPGYWRTEQGHNEMIRDTTRVNSASGSETSSIKEKVDEVAMGDLLELPFNIRTYDCDSTSETDGEAHSPTSDGVTVESPIVESPASYNCDDSDSSSDNGGELVPSPKSTNLVELGKVDNTVEQAKVLAAPVAKPKVSNGPVDVQSQHERLVRALQLATEQPDYTGQDGLLWIHYAGRKLPDDAHPRNPPATRAATPAMPDEHAAPAQSAVPLSQATQISGPVSTTRVPAPATVVQAPTHAQFPRILEIAHSTTAPVPTRMPLPRRKTQEQVEKLKKLVEKRAEAEVRRCAIRARHEAEERALEERGSTVGSELRNGLLRMTNMHAQGAQ